MLKFNQLFPLVDELSKAREDWPDVIDWAHRLSACLPPAGDGKTSVVPSLRKLAESYFNHLGLACMSLLPELRYECLELISDQVWNLLGNSTPDSSIHPTPNHDLIDTDYPSSRSKGGTQVVAQTGGAFRDLSFRCPCS